MMSRIKPRESAFAASARSKRTTVIAPMRSTVRCSNSMFVVLVREGSAG